MGSGEIIHGLIDFCLQENWIWFESVIGSYEKWHMEDVPAKAVVNSPLVLGPNERRFAAEIGQMHRSADFPYHQS